MTKFKIGDIVTWTSQAQGSAKTKTGRIEVVKAAGAGLSEDQIRELRGAGLPRPQESYLVRVPGATARARGKLYWPVASLLNGA